MNDDMIKSIVSTIAVWALGFVSVKMGLDQASLAGIATAVAALAVGLWKMLQHSTPKAA